MNTDAKLYGGSGRGNSGEVVARRSNGGVAAAMTLPPLATVMLEYVPDEEG